MSRNTRLLAATLLSAVFLGFQNCSQVDVSFAPMSDLANLSQVRIMLNGGAPLTNSVNVEVTTFSANTVVMYVTNDSSCLTGGDWLGQAEKLPWTLLQENQVARVFAKFKTASGHETECVEADITHDNQSPVVQILQTPNSLSTDVDAAFVFEATDAVSGVEKVECRVDANAFAPCSLNEVVKQLNDDHHVIQVRATDKAGNTSPESTYDWLIDTTAPTVQITSMPAAVSNSRLASFEFSGTDAGSGVAGYKCSLDGGAAQDCASPIMYPNVQGDNHTFVVVAKDKAGHMSAPATYQFTIDDVAPGNFDILGVTSTGSDIKIDSWMRGMIPTVHWTPSAGAANYNASILNQAGTQVVCAAQSTQLTTFTFPSSCSLQNLTRFTAKVDALDQLGNATSATLLFTVDTTPPVIQLAGPGNSPQNAAFTFSVADAAPGELDVVTCTKTFQNVPVSQDCKGLTSLSYTGLPYGDHTFRIDAKDKADNVSNREITFRVAPLICDPFSNMGDCKGGLVGDLYYLDAAKQTAFKALSTKTVQYFFDNGIRVNAILNLGQLFVPTRQFDQGFPTADGNTIKDNAGNTLVEYFAMRLKSVIRLDTTNPDMTKRDAAGYYEFATLSDDGSKLKLAEDSMAPLATIVSNDGDHSTKLSCSSTVVYMEAGVGKPIQLEYYQGPRTEIAVTLLWRKVSGSTPQGDTLCGTTGTTTFFGPYPYSNTTNAYGFGKLVDRGWKVMSPYNFVAP